MTSQTHNPSSVGPRRLAFVALGLSVFQTAFGALTRGSGSGFGCRDRWPLCDGGALGGLLPRVDDPAMIIEWSHRWLAAMVGLADLALAIAVWRHQRSLTRRAVAAVGVVAIQGVVGAAVVREYGNADLVTLHLLGALALLAVLTDVAVRTTGRQPANRSPSDRRWSRLHAVAALGAFTTLVLGSSVHDLYVDGWPLVHDRLVPPIGTSPWLDRHIAHRVIAGLMLPLLAWMAFRLTFRDRRSDIERGLVWITLALFVLNVAIGGVHVFTQVSSTAAIVAHLGIGATAWTSAVAAWSWSRTRDAAPRGRRPGRGDARHRSMEATADANQRLAHPSSADRRSPGCAGVARSRS